MLSVTNVCACCRPATCPGDRIDFNNEQLVPFTLVRNAKGELKRVFSLTETFPRLAMKWIPRNQYVCASICTHYQDKIPLPPNPEVAIWNSFHINDTINTRELLMYLHTYVRRE